MAGWLCRAVSYKTADPFVKITVALGEKACYNNAETSVHKKSITQSQEDNGYGIY